MIALFVASRAGIAPFPLWARLGLPSFVELSLPDYEVTAIVHALGPAALAQDSDVL